MIREHRSAGWQKPSRRHRCRWSSSSSEVSFLRELEMFSTSERTSLKLCWETLRRVDSQHWEQVRGRIFIKTAVLSVWVYHISVLTFCTMLYQREINELAVNFGAKWLSGKTVLILVFSMLSLESSQSSQI